MKKKVALLCLQKYCNIQCVSESINNIKKYSEHNVDIIKMDIVTDSISKRAFIYYKSNIGTRFPYSFIVSQFKKAINESVDIDKKRNMASIPPGRKEMINIIFKYKMKTFKSLLKYDAIIYHWDLIDCSIVGKIFLNFLRNFKGIKICMMQDEYMHNMNFVKDNNFDFFYHVSDSRLINKYCKNKIGEIELRQVLTGYVPDIDIKKVNMKDKTINIFSRGRTKSITYFYGRMLRDKGRIGYGVKIYCKKNNIPNVDIEMEDKYRIYGDKWYDKLRNSKTLLACQSGCDVFHVSKKEVDDYQKEHPNALYNEIKDIFNLEKESENNYGVVSPKMFEAIKCNCVLIMFPGGYNNILIPDVHFIKLERDFSNMDEVIKKVYDNDYLQKIADKAYEDIVESGKYSYQYFVKNTIDKDIESFFPTALGAAFDVGFDEKGREEKVGFYKNR